MIARLPWLGRRRWSTRAYPTIECEEECRTAPDRALSPDLPAMPADDALDGREPDPGPFEFCCRMQTLEDSEELRRMGHVETGAIVSHEIGATLVPCDADLDPRLGTCGREFPGICRLFR